MVSMEVDKLTMFVILLFTFSLQGLMAMSPQEQNKEKQLLSINKPAVKSFKTKYGDILDCVEIHKQLAFVHPLLKNHSIQMRPTKDITKSVKSSSMLKTQQILPRNIRCPNGTVLVRRVQKKEISHVKFSKFWATHMIANSQRSFDDSKPQLIQGHQVAILTTREKNIGVHGNINVWGPEVAANALSSALIFAASDDGSVQNYIEAGWSVNSALYPNYTRLHVFWTKDSSRTTGCFNLLCPGFVQVSRDFTPGLVLQPLSTFGGPQYMISITIKQDTATGNWWVNYGGNPVGYYPRELFTTLKGGADGVGWGGEIAGPITEPLPGMGSGNFPELGPQKACYISQMEILGNSGQVNNPDPKSLIKYVSKSDCYRVVYGGDKGGQFGSFMFFGGPPDCKI